MASPDDFTRVQRDSILGMAVDVNQCGTREKIGYVSDRRLNDSSASEAVETGVINTAPKRGSKFHVPKLIQ